MGADGGGSGKGAAVGFAGAVIGAIAIFTPGLWIVVGFMSLWQRIRKVRAVGSILRGVNAAAVGLVWTAVYRLASIGYIDEKYERGTSLGVDGWWVAVTGVAFAVGRWWGVGPVGVILGGGVAGLLWYAVVRA